MSQFGWVKYRMPLEEGMNRGDCLLLVADSIYISEAQKKRMGRDYMRQVHQRCYRTYFNLNTGQFLYTKGDGAFERNQLISLEVENYD